MTFPMILFVAVCIGLAFLGVVYIASVLYDERRPWWEE